MLPCIIIFLQSQLAFKLPGTCLFKPKLALSYCLTNINQIDSLLFTNLHKFRQTNQTYTLIGPKYGNYRKYQSITQNIENIIGTGGLLLFYCLIPVINILNWNIFAQ